MADSPAPVPVLFVLTDLRVGGMERKVVEIVQKIDRRRIRPVVACLKEAGALAPEVEAAGVPLYSRLIRGRTDFLVLWRLRRVIRREGIRVVCTVGDGGDRMFWGRLAARLCRLPGIVSTLHSTRNPGGGSILDRPNRWLFGLTDAFVAVAAGAARYLVEEEGFPPEKVVVIYNGVDLDRYTGAGREAARAALGLPADAPVVAHVAAFRPEKAHDVLLRAAARVVARLPAARFLLIGDGPERPRIEALRSELGLEEAVRLLGRRSDIPELLAAADLAVLCSHPMVETFPNSVLEAMASRRPVVSTRVGSVDEQIEDGVEGFLVPPGDPEALADRILRVLENPGLARRMGEAAREKVEKHFSAARMVGDREELFLALAAGRGVPARLYWQNPPRKA
ncbi:MAG: glycosyltransferase [Planctomycetota bacterium]|nr:MAG: glycosyltransferase [Planctomycetota bacterium]